MKIIATVELENGTRFFFSESFRISLAGKKSGTPIVALDVLEDSVAIVRANGTTLNIGDPKMGNTDEDGVFETFCRMVDIEKEISERLTLVGEHASNELRKLLAPFWQ